MQAKDLADTPTTQPAEVPTPVRPAEPSGPTGWVSLSLGVLAALVAGLTVLAVRRVSRRDRAGHAPDQGRGHVVRWGCRRPPGSPSAFNEQRSPRNDPYG